MGNCNMCMRRADIEIGAYKSEISSRIMESQDQEDFDRIVQEAQVPETHRDGCIGFKFTWLPTVDKIILDAQKTVNQIHQVRFSILSTVENLYERTTIWKVPGANTHHAIVALVYSIIARNDSEANFLLKIEEDYPYFKFDTTRVTDDVLRDIKLLEVHFEIIKDAGKDISKMWDDSCKLSKNSRKLKKKAKKDMMKKDKFTPHVSREALAYNSQSLVKMKQLSKNTMKMFSSWTYEIKQAAAEIKNEQEKFGEYKCMLNSKFFDNFENHLYDL